MTSALPIIDLEVDAIQDSAWGERVGGAISRAFTQDGFLYLINHGISDETFSAVRAASLSFFSLPASEKQKVATSKIHRGYHSMGDARMEGAAMPDRKAFFQLGLDLPETDPDVIAGQPLRGPNQWPEPLPHFRVVMEDYYRQIGQVGETLLKAVAWSLGINPDFFRDKYHKPLQRTQTIYYPASQSNREGEFGVAPHSDYGCITLLYQDGVGGLQVLNRQDEWIQAPPVSGALVVNVGDLLFKSAGFLFAASVLEKVLRLLHKRFIFSAVSYTD